MPIVGFNFDKILVEKKHPISNQVKINSDLSIKDLQEEKVSIGKTEDLLKFIFEFKVSYDNLGEILLVGHVLYLEDQKKINDILKEWKKNKKIPDELMALLINTALFKCNIKALTLSQEVNLPPHLRMPRLAPSKDLKEYIG